MKKKIFLEKKKNFEKNITKSVFFKKLKINYFEKKCVFQGPMCVFLVPNVFFGPKCVILVKNVFLGSQYGMSSETIVLDLLFHNSGPFHIGFQPI